MGASFFWIITRSTLTGKLGVSPHTAVRPAAHYAMLWRPERRSLGRGRATRQDTPKTDKIAAKVRGIASAEGRQQAPGVEIIPGRPAQHPVLPVAVIPILAPLPHVSAQIV